MAEKRVPEDQLLPPAVKFEEAGDTVSGWYRGVSKHVPQSDGRFSLLHEVLCEGGELKAFWGGVQLDHFLRTAPAGLWVRIVFAGTEGRMKRFEVYTDADKAAPGASDDADLPV